MTSQSELTWTEGGGSWTAVGRDGTHWEIIRSGEDVEYYIYVAHWDRSDWSAGTIEEAKRLVAEIDARPPIPPEEQIPEQWPVLEVEGDQFAEFNDEPPPISWTDCRSCGSSRQPERVKPIRHTPKWWFDPDAVWRCPDCRVERSVG
ncbi:MAG: hypothetical protein M3459_12495 [Actinomycetota bacterium]|nr:hypothetical protein [Actinomycetota bacterium]